MRTLDPRLGQWLDTKVRSQLLGLALCRCVFELPPAAAMPVERIVREIGATVERYLTGG